MAKRAAPRRDDSVVTFDVRRTGASPTSKPKASLALPLTATLGELTDGMFDRWLGKPLSTEVATT